MGAPDAAARPAPERLGVALGGQAGARLAARLGWRTSPDTLLRLVQAAPVPDAPAPHIIGVDEWAWRRGQRYGTILVNLEDHRVLDLLPERSADSVATWLAQYPTVLVVCRDRSALYAEGIRRGAPQAVQVVDRFHLVKNLREAVEAFLHSQRPALQAAAARTAQALTLVAGPGAHHPDVSRAAPVHARRDNSGGRRSNNSDTSPGSRLTRPSTPCAPRDACRHDRPATRHQPSYGVCVLAADQPPESTEPPAVRAGLKPLLCPT